MKNPETEAISGFCSKFHFLLAEKEGLFHDPIRKNPAELN
jgi:hypothetical protein